MKHELKTDPNVFRATWDGYKFCEIRVDDRNYQVGDFLLLRETKHSGRSMKEPEGLSVGEKMPLIYTGREILVEVTHKLKDIYGLKDEWCLLSHKETHRRDS